VVKATPVTVEMMTGMTVIMVLKVFKVWRLVKKKMSGMKRRERMRKWSE
ncbi:hypothetical protein Tco_0920884, partial [Tanacetum coccineum]